MKELYTPQIMALAANIPASGCLAAYMGEASLHSRLCGSRLRVTLDIEDGKVSRFGQEVKACLVGQASAAIIGGNILGCKREEIVRLHEQLRLMLEENAPPPNGKWAGYALLEPVRNYSARHSTLLMAPAAVIHAMEMAQMNMMQIDRCNPNEVEREQ